MHERPIIVMNGHFRRTNGPRRTVAHEGRSRPWRHLEKNRGFPDFAPQAVASTNNNLYKA